MNVLSQITCNGYVIAGGELYHSQPCPMHPASARTACCSEQRIMLGLCNCARQYVVHTTGAAPTWHNFTAAAR